MTIRRASEPKAEPWSVGRGVAAGRRLAGILRSTGRQLIERGLHARRSERALKRVRQLRPRSVLIVCLGNICRSPFAERALQRALAGYDVSVSSVGLIGRGRPSPQNALYAARDRGIDLTSHRSRLIGQAVLQAHELIVVMDSAQRRTIITDHQVPSDRVLVLGDLDRPPIESRTIVDPYGCAPEVFSACFSRIERCLENLAAVLIQTLSSSAALAGVSAADRPGPQIHSRHQ